MAALYPIAADAVELQHRTQASPHSYHQFECSVSANGQAFAPQMRTSSLAQLRVTLPSQQLAERDNGAAVAVIAAPAVPASTHVSVMLPLDTVSAECVFHYAAIPWFTQALHVLAASGVHSVAFDVWWGAVEKEPRQYNWSAYKQLIEVIKPTGLKIQVVLSFHACGGNVGDTARVPLPSWVLQSGQKDPDLFFTDRPRGNTPGSRNREYISVWADDEAGVLCGRSPMQCYEDFMSAFREAFEAELGSIVDEVVVGSGPCGELRYPSYLEAHGWKYPGIGEFQCYDRRAMASLAAAARAAGHPEWGATGPHDAGEYNSQPEETGFFKTGGSWDTPYGRFFLNWYSGCLLRHGDRLLAAASLTLLGARPLSLPWSRGRSLPEIATSSPARGSVFRSLYSADAAAAAAQAGLTSPSNREPVWWVGSGRGASMSTHPSSSALAAVAESFPSLWPSTAEAHAGIGGPGSDSSGAGWGNSNNTKHLTPVPAPDAAGTSLAGGAAEQQGCSSSAAIVGLSTKQRALSTSAVIDAAPLDVPASVTALSDTQNARFSPAAAATASTSLSLQAPPDAVRVRSGLLGAPVPGGMVLSGSLADSSGSAVTPAWPAAATQHTGGSAGRGALTAEALRLAAAHHHGRAAAASGSARRASGACPADPAGGASQATSPPPPPLPLPLVAESTGHPLSRSCSATCAYYYNGANGGVSSVSALMGTGPPAARSSSLAHQGRLGQPRRAPATAPGTVTLTLKVAGVHWWYRSASHAAELTAGYGAGAVEGGRDAAYCGLVDTCAKHHANLTLTCVEMCDAQHPPSAASGPEGLLKQIRTLAAQRGVSMSGENALPIFLSNCVDAVALDRVVANSRAVAAPLLPSPAGQRTGLASLSSSCASSSTSHGSSALSWGPVSTNGTGGGAEHRLVGHSGEGYSAGRDVAAAAALMAVEASASVGLPPLRSFTMLRLGPELLQPSHHVPWQRFMQRMRCGGS